MNKALNIITQEVIDELIENMEELMKFNDTYESAAYIGYLADEYNLIIPDEFKKKYNL